MTPDPPPDADRPRVLGTHELVLLHGQPGSPADWLLVAGRLPARFHAIAADRPGYGASQRAAGGFAANARAILDELDSRGIERAVLVGHSYGGGVALSAASLAPHRVEAVVLLASVGPGCVNGWDRLLAAPGAGPLCALVAWRLTPWIARARLSWTARRRGGPPGPGEYVNWQVWAQAGPEHGRLWRTFLTEQRALLRELPELEHAVPSIQPPVLLLADPHDAVMPADTAPRWRRPFRTPDCSWSQEPAIICPGGPRMRWPARSCRSWPRWKPAAVRVGRRRRPGSSVAARPVTRGHE